jgi:hypothetical protein
MLSVDFEGCEAYRLQLIGLQVASDTVDGVTLCLNPGKSAPRAKTSDSGEITCGTYEDSDRVKVEIVLVARRGCLRFLDRMKLDPVREALVLFPLDDRIAVQKSSPPIHRPYPNP